MCLWLNDFWQGCQDHSTEKKIVSLTNDVGTTRHLHATEWSWNSDLTYSQKVTQRWNNNLNKRAKPIKLLKENEKNFMSLNLGMNFWMYAKSKGNKGKNKQLNTKSLCAWRDAINAVKRQPTEWEKIFANGLSDEGLIRRIYKELQ